MSAMARITKSPASQVARPEFEGVLEFRVLERRAARMLCGDASDGNSLRVRSDRNKLDDDKRDANYTSPADRGRTWRTTPAARRGLRAGRRSVGVRERHPALPSSARSLPCERRGADGPLELPTEARLLRGSALRWEGIIEAPGAAPPQVVGTPCAARAAATEAGDRHFNASFQRVDTRPRRRARGSRLRSA